MIKKIKKTNEDESQKFICSWCVQNNLVPVAVPNGFNLGAAMSLFKKNGLSIKELQTLNAVQIKMLKKEGLHTGFPDLMIFGNSIDQKNILFLENKVKNNKVSKVQELCHIWLRSLGFTVECGKNSVDAIKKIKNYFFTSEFQDKNAIYKKERLEL